MRSMSTGTQSFVAGMIWDSGRPPATTKIAT
jgi:hypothetical protein